MRRLGTAEILIGVLFALVWSCGGPTVQEDSFEFVSWDELDPTTNDDVLEVHFFDVGQGDSAVMVTPNGRVVLLDAGPSGRADGLVADLRALGIERINLAIMSHAHADHIGGYPTILDHFEVMRFGDPGFVHTSEMYHNLLARLETEGIPAYLLARGQVIRMDDEIELTVLGPNESHLTGTRSDCNANSAILLLAYGEIQILFTGDSEEATEQELVAANVLPDIEVLKVAHHGGAYSTYEPFLGAIQPEVAVISVGAGNSYGHPDEETVVRLEVFGTVYRTDLMGTVVIRTDGELIAIQTERGEPVRLAIGGYR